MKPQHFPATPPRCDATCPREAVAASGGGRASLRARIALAAAIMALMAWALPAQALVLGAASVRSSLGQPLLAEVPILDGDGASLAAALAPRALHQRHGVSSPQHALGRIDVRLVESGGERLIRVTSERPVREPILQLLLEASDRRGHIVRELALLFDPPETALAGAATPSGATTRHARAHRIAAPDGDQFTHAAERPVAASAKARPAGARARPAAARKGQARLARSPVKVRSAARSATVRAADRPTAGTALARTPGAAPAPRTALAPAAAALADAAPGEARATQGPAAPSADPSLQALATELPAAEAPPHLGAANHGPGIDAVVGISTAAAATPESAAPAASAPVTAAESRSGPRLVDYALAAGALALLACLLALRRRRRRGQDRAAEPVSSELSLSASDVSLTFGTGYGTCGESEVTTHAGPTALPRHVRAPQDGMLALEADEEVDPLAEAEVYVAYGRIHQAKAILEDAVHHQPQRAALHLKLLSIHREQRDALAFKERARALALLTGQRGPEWHEACAMGQALIPGDTLFLASEALPLSERSADASWPAATHGAFAANSQAWPQPEQPFPDSRHSSRAAEAQAANQPPAASSLCDTDTGTLGLGTGRHWSAPEGVVRDDDGPDLDLFDADDCEAMPPGGDTPEEPAPAGAAVAGDMR